MNATVKAVLAAGVLGGLALSGCKKEQAPAAAEDDFVLSEVKVEPRGEAAPSAPAAAPAPAPAEAAAPRPFTVRVATVSTAAADVAKGQELFGTKGCTACHKVGGGKLVGPDLKGVTARREQGWVEAMILEPERMLREDATAKELLKTHLVPMPNQGVDPDKELPLLLAYLKSVEK